MENTIPVELSLFAVARLIILNQVKLDKLWTLEQSKDVNYSIATMSIEEILDIIDSAAPGYYSTDEIPQFGSIDSLARVPGFVLREGACGLNYAQLGFKLKNDVYAKMDANIKFGENHGKGTALLGLIQFSNKRFLISSLTIGFCNLDDTLQRHEILRLFFRIPIVKAIIKDAKTQRTNGYNYMNGMTESTKRRRGQCLRAIFRELNELNNPILSKRIENIYWEIES